MYQLPVCNSQRLLSFLPFAASGTSLKRARFWYLTWVVVENNVEEILVTPCDVVLVLLVKGMKHVLP